MTYNREHEEFPFASEEPSQYCRSGSFSLSQSVSVRESFSLTPPDSVSNSPFSDCLDMDAPPWEQVTLPMDWPIVPPQEDATGQDVTYEWPSGDIPSNVSVTNSLGPTAWLDTEAGPMDIGLSPVLSHKTQDSHHFSSYPESHSQLFQPQLDLSYVHNDPEWDHPILGDYMPDYDPNMPADWYSGISEAAQLGGKVQPVPTLYPAAMPPGLHGPAQPGPNQSRRAMRNLQPRKEVTVVDEAPFDARARAALSPVRDEHALADTTWCVSSSPYISLPDALSGTTPSTHRVRPADHRAISALAVPPELIGPEHPSSSHGGPVGLISPLSAHTASGFNDFPFVDSEEPEDSLDISTSGTSRSITVDHDRSLPVHDTHASSSEPSRPAGYVKHIQVPLKDEDRMVQRRRAPHMDTDEGRSRNHPYYNHGPSRDGFYHCPYETSESESCGHLPTKLKCNYDKYIDSHVKPFRCKKENCARLEFSSTACRLRHEREAHGLHGYGDKPHLCLYADCDRSVQGKGFPRKYNLYDHMKRVHSYKEDSSSLEEHAHSRDNKRRKKGAKRTSGGRGRKIEGNVSQLQGAVVDALLSTGSQHANAIPTDTSITHSGIPGSAFANTDAAFRRSSQSLAHGAPVYRALMPRSSPEQQNHFSSVQRETHMQSTNGGGHIRTDSRNLRGVGARAKPGSVNYNSRAS